LPSRLWRTQWGEADVNSQLERHGIIGNSTNLPRRAGDRSELGFRVGSTPMTIRGLGVEGFAAVTAAVATIIERGPGAPVDVKLRQDMKDVALAHPIPF
jgi:glycine/serine hydroxymethyltransferase